MASSADRVFLGRFERCELPEADWTHLAHIRIAWIYLSTLPASEALQRIRQGILRYNTEVLQRRHKYHETVTVAFTRIVADRMRSGESWEVFSRRIADLLDTETPLLLRYYSKNRLFSDIAKNEFLEPDLEKIPPITEDLQRLKNG
ncbi:MAG: hypothetical protein ACR2Q3_04415 [Woeseiaceae bacterium]